MKPVWKSVSQLDILLNFNQANVITRHFCTKLPLTRLYTLFSEFSKFFIYILSFDTPTRKRGAEFLFVPEKKFNSLSTCRAELRRIISTFPAGRVFLFFFFFLFPLSAFMTVPVDESKNRKFTAKMRSDRWRWIIAGRVSSMKKD